MLKPPKGCTPTIAPVILRFRYRLPTWKSSPARASRPSSAREQAAGQAILGVVGDRHGLLEIVGLDEGQHRAEDLLLRQPRVGRNIGEDRRLHEVARRRPAPRRPAPAGPPRWPSARYWRILSIERSSITAPSAVSGLAGIAHAQRARALDHLRQQRIVHRGDRHHARAGRAFLALEAKGRGGDALRSRIQVGRLIDDGGVLATHLQHRALDPLLAGLNLSGALVDPQANLLRAGEARQSASWDDRPAHRRSPHPRR